MPQRANQVPEELMRQLHHATEHFHECKQELERAMDGSEYRHQERVNAAEARLRDAERELEQIEEKIKKVLPA